MINWSLGIGTATLIGVGVLVITPFIPDAAPIRVASLFYKDGFIHTDRTITADGPIFYLRRSPEIVDSKTGEPAPNCSGTEGRNVTVGNVVADIPLAVWVNNPLCTPESLQPGEYTPQIVYRWGDKQMPYVGTSFRIEAKP